MGQAFWSWQLEKRDASFMRGLDIGDGEVFNNYQGIKGDLVLNLVFYYRFPAYNIYTQTVLFT